jgi:2-oxoglutarate ferredoxin oxidoreductase subunit alpha
VTGNVSYNSIAPRTDGPRLRAEKVARLAEIFPGTRRVRAGRGRVAAAELGRHVWRGALGRGLARGGACSVAHAHVRYLNPFPRNLRDLLSRYRQ